MSIKRTFVHSRTSALAGFAIATFLLLSGLGATPVWAQSDPIENEVPLHWYG